MLKLALKRFSGAAKLLDKHIPSSSMVVGGDIQPYSDLSSDNNNNNSTKMFNSIGSTKLDLQNMKPAENSSEVVCLLKKTNSFLLQGLQPRENGSVRPLMVAGQRIGMLKPSVAAILCQYDSVFHQTPQGEVLLNPQLSSYASRSAAVASVLSELRVAGVSAALRTWRGENFDVWGRGLGAPLLEVERSAMAFLGIRAYGVQMTGYVRSPDDGRITGIWLQKRADDKPTYPGMMDTMVGGGIAAGYCPAEVLVKEAAEEASLPEDLVKQAVSAGSVSFFMETDRGLHANTEHVYDIELPPSFVPLNSDGEVQGFCLVPIEDIKSYLFSPNYKLSSVPTLIDFLIRHGIINSENTPDLPQACELLHTPLSFYFQSWPIFPSIPHPMAEESSPKISDDSVEANKTPEGKTRFASWSSTLSCDSGVASTSGISEG